MTSVQVSLWRVLAACAIWALLAAPTPAPAQEIARDGQHIVGPYDYLFGYGYQQNAEGTRTATYYAITPAMGLVRALGATTFPFPLDAAYDPIEDAHYDMVLSGDGFTYELWKTKGKTGVATRIGTETFAWGTSLAYQSSTGQLFYAFHYDEGAPSVGLIRIDPVTGEQTVVGPCDGSIASVCWNPASGALYGLTTSDGQANTVVSIDLQTAQTSNLFELDLFYFASVATVDPTGHWLSVIYYAEDVGPRDQFSVVLAVYSLQTGKPSLPIPLHGDIDGGHIDGPSDLFFAPPELMRP